MATQEALILSIALVGLAAMLRLLTGTWLHPAAFFALFWSFAGVFPLIFAPQEPVGANAVAWLIVSSLAVAAGAIAGNGGFKTTRIAEPGAVPRTELFVLSLILAVAIPLGIGSSIGFLAGNSVPFGDLLDIEKLVVASNKGYFIRYAETGPPRLPLASRGLLPFVYLAPTVGGMLFRLRREKTWKFLALTSLLPAVVVTVLQTTKAATLFAICLWLATYFAARLRQGELAVFTRGHLLVAGLFGALLTAFFFAVQLARLAVLDSSLLGLVMEKLVTSAFGHMTAFSQWLTEYPDQPFAPTLGTYTFAGPLEMLGYGQRIPGIYPTIIELVTGDNTNVYTAFRPLIEDFTMPGALAVLSLLGFVGGVGFRMVAIGRWSAVPLLIAAYTTIMWTPVTWFWLYNSLTATVLAIGVILFFIRILRGAPRGPAPSRGAPVTAATIPPT